MLSLARSFSPGQTMPRHPPAFRLLLLLLCCMGACRFSVAQPANATIEGTVLDPDGDSIAGAQIKLMGDALAVPGKTVTDDDGHFRFPGIAPGKYSLSVEAKGFATATQSIDLTGQSLTLPAMKLAVATDEEDEQVTLTRHDEAEGEIKDEETQRIAGIFPNFYVTYNWNAAPLTAKQKYKLAARNLIDPVNIGLNVANAGVQQGLNAFPGYGQGTQGYFKRLGADNADFAIGSMLGGAVLPALLHQDPRYFYKGTGSIRSRLLYALAAGFICRGDNGRWQPNYSSVLGDLGAGAASNLYYPAGSRNGVALTLETGALSIGYDALGNVIQEFVIRYFTPHAPTYAPTPVPTIKTTP